MAAARAHASTASVNESLRSCAMRARSSGEPVSILQNAATCTRRALSGARAVGEALQRSKARTIDRLIKRRDFAEDFMLGGVSAAISKTAAAPIERVKLNIQNQGEMLKQGIISSA